MMAIDAAMPICRRLPPPADATRCCRAIRNMPHATAHALIASSTTIAATPPRHLIVTPYADAVAALWQR